MVLIIGFLIALFFWTDIKKIILGKEYQAVTAPISGTVIDKDLKKKIISQLEKFRQYGEWPISIDNENPDRGDPFKPKQQ